MKMENLGEPNKLYNFQDTIILCEILESQASFLSKKFKFNPRKFKSAISHIAVNVNVVSRCHQAQKL